MNPLALLLPNHRASVSAFVLGIVILLVVDAVRLSVGTGPVPGLIPLFAVWFVCFSLLANRRRHAGRSTGLAFLPVVLAIVAKGIGAMVGAGIGTYEAMLTYATEQGVAVDDQAEMTATGRSGPHPGADRRDDLAVLHRLLGCPWCLRDLVFDHAPQWLVRASGLRRFGVQGRCVGPADRPEGVGPGDVQGGVEIVHAHEMSEIRQ